MSGIVNCRNSGTYTIINKKNTSISSIITAKTYSGEIVIIKSLRMECMNDLANLDLLLRFKQELQMVTEIEYHPNIVNIITIDSFNGKDCIIEENVHGQTLEDSIESGNIANVNVISCFLGLAHALNFLWQKYRITHRDLRPRNILIDADGNAKLIDFGLSYILAGDSDFKYQPPERLGSADYCYNFKSEIYSFGVMLYESLRGNIIENVDSKIDLIPNISNDINILILKCISRTPDERPTYDEIISILHACPK